MTAAQSPSMGASAKACCSLCGRLGQQLARLCFGRLTRVTRRPLQGDEHSPAIVLSSRIAGKLSRYLLAREGPDRRRSFTVASAGISSYGSPTAGPDDTRAGLR